MAPDESPCVGMWGFKVGFALESVLRITATAAGYALATPVLNAMTAQH